jgi:hypothetical protein
MQCTTALESARRYVAWLCERLRACGVLSTELERRMKSTSHLTNPRGGDPDGDWVWRPDLSALDAIYGPCEVAVARCWEREFSDQVGGLLLRCSAGAALLTCPVLCLSFTSKSPSLTLTLPLTLSFSLSCAQPRERMSFSAFLAAWEQRTTEPLADPPNRDTGALYTKDFHLCIERPDYGVHAAHTCALGALTQRQRRTACPNTSRRTG